MITANQHCSMCAAWSRSYLMGSGAQFTLEVILRCGAPPRISWFDQYVLCSATARPMIQKITLRKIDWANLLCTSNLWSINTGYISYLANSSETMRMFLTIVAILRAGLLRAIQYTLRVVEEGLLHGGPPCGTFVFINRSTSKRTGANADGDPEVRSVGIANMFLDWQHILIR